MRVLVIGGTWFLGRRVVERLHERRDEVLVAHRGRSVPDPWVAVTHLLTDRHDLARHGDKIRAFRAGGGLPQSISGLWRADLFLGSVETEYWVGTTVKINQAALQGDRGLRVGIVPACQLVV